MFGSDGIFSTFKAKQKPTENGVFIEGQLLPLMIQLQKETRGRKFREIQNTLQEAVTALLSFQAEVWPKEPEEATHATAETSSEVSISTQSAAGDDDEGKPFDELRLAPSDDDPQTREEMHGSIVLTLEAFMAVLSHPSKTPKSCEYALDGIARLVSNKYVSGRAGRAADDGSDPSILHRLLESVAKCSEHAVSAVQAAVLATLRAIMTSSKCGVHENAMLTVLRTSFHVYLVVTQDENKQLAKDTLQDILRVVFFRMEAFDVQCRSWQLQREKLAAAAPVEEAPPVRGRDAPSGEEEKVDTRATADSSATIWSQYHNDSYALFRIICKLSSKELPADTVEEPDRSRMLSFTSSQTQTDPLALNSKILALECILVALERFCGPAFCQGEKFVHLVQHYLCVSLLKNCVSHHTQVAFVSQRIFVVLINKFKGNLKEEIAVFLSNVFLRVLNSPNMSFKQKAVVLESLRGLCGDPVLLTQIFLNYDCDLDSTNNSYKDIIHALTKLGGKATTASSSVLPSNKKDAEHEFDLSLAGVEVLLASLKAFLKALGLSLGNEEADDIAGQKLRDMLNLDVKLASGTEEAKAKENESGHGSVSSNVSSSFVTVDGQGIESESNDGAGRIVDAFEMKRKAQQNFEIGSVKFTLSLKSGLQFFIENNFVELDARATARFFLNNKDKLDKTQMGEALGREPDSAFVKTEGIDAEKGGPGFWVRILYHYVDAQDFTGLLFDDAIRSFLSGFRLPGEAQKIDRIMEKFAERFTSQNPEIFPSADTAFILAFSVIMLNTDLHNPSIKPERRMTIDSFIKNNRGIGENGTDLPQDFLRGIFDRIKERPFSLKEDDAARERAGAQSSRQIFDTSKLLDGSAIFGNVDSEEKKRERFKKERDEMMAVTQKLMRQKPSNNERFVADSAKLTDSIAPADVVKPMFDVTWGPIIGILSQILERSDDERMVAVCLKGFQYAVRLASANNMVTARDTYISSLAKFTFLGSIKEMKQKNVESIRTLLEIAIVDGEHLGESWQSVLQCISQLARLRLSASGLDSDESFLVENEKESQKKAVPTPARMGDFFRAPSLRNSQKLNAQKINQGKEATELNGRAVLESVQEVLIDKVFSSTVNLSANSLAHFIGQLIAVSTSEIQGNLPAASTNSSAIPETSRRGQVGHGPSIYSLQRLVDVADHNMLVRPRLVWTQIWELMADFFAQNACHSNSMVSVFAIDSLKQLSFKFLEKPELSEFNFQRLFLKPFLEVMENEETREEIRELVLQCVDNMVRTKSANLRSGWKIVFAILTCSASDSSQKIEYLGLGILQRLLDEHLEDVCNMDESPVESKEESGESATARKRLRNGNAEDFVNLCKASLSFVERNHVDTVRPVGLSLRALCHTAIFADLLASGRICSPESGLQYDHPEKHGYSYSGLNEQDALEMILWRPIFEGLANGVESSSRESEAGVGCIVPRASVLSLRAILIRHGKAFSADQLAAILEQTLFPSLNRAVKSDATAVVQIISESPSISSIDFLEDPLPLPPDSHDPKLKLFEETMSSQKRPMGSAELMLEASFTDLRHGGDGDLRFAYELAKKDDVASIRQSDQPFPDSWIATTAPAAFGLITDIVISILLTKGADEVRRIWKILQKQFTHWFFGCDSWRPCEATVRISCQESRRLSEAVLSRIQGDVWVPLIAGLLADFLSVSVDSQRRSHKILAGSDHSSKSRRAATTKFGKGELIEEKTISYEGVSIKILSIKLKWDAFLFCSLDSDVAILKEDKEIGIIPSETKVEAGVFASVPYMKVRCVAAHCVNSSVSDIAPLLVPHIPDQGVIDAIFSGLNSSRDVAASLLGNKAVATAFQEALVSDWGDAGMPDIEATARESLLHGSAVFFLAQEAGASKAVAQMVSLMYVRSTTTLAETHFLGLLKGTVTKFIESEIQDSHLMYPTAWQSAGEHGRKPAVYYTYFVPVVTELLKIVRSMTADQIATHKQAYFSIACKLIRVQSEEIRILVQAIFEEKFAPMINVVPHA